MKRAACLSVTALSPKGASAASASSTNALTRARAGSTPSRPTNVAFAREPGRLYYANYGGNGSMYINHSCDPNCEAVIEQRRVYLEALRTIAAGWKR